MVCAPLRVAPASAPSPQRPVSTPSPTLRSRLTQAGSATHPVSQASSPKPLLITLLCVLLLASCSERSHELVVSGLTMGTTYTVRVVAPPTQLTPHTLRSMVEEELARVDATMSGYRNDSEIVRFNTARTTDWLEISPELAYVVSAALEVARRSNGAFDVTAAPLVRLWGFGPAADEHAPLPDAVAIASVRSRVGSSLVHLQFQPPSIRKDEPLLEIDLNAIAPGYAVDRIATRLEQSHVKRYLVDVGGEIRTRGTNREGKRWRVAVENPSRIDAPPLAVLEVADRAIATSGGYRQFVEKEGQRFSHTIDPRTGAPVAHRLASVVVAHDLAMYADAWATAYNVLGPEEGYELAVRLNMAAMFIIYDSCDDVGISLRVKMTPEFERAWGSGVRSETVGCRL